MRRLAVLALVALGLLMVLVTAWTPAPPAPSAPVPARSRELDEAAEEVRAVATAISRLEEKIAQRVERERTLQEEIARLHQRVSSLDQRAERPPVPAPAPAVAPAPPAEPLQLDSLVNQVVAPFGAAAAPADRALVWVEPVLERGPGPQRSAIAADGEARTAPRFVIPPALLSGRALTALVGRVPRGGSVQDPWPFLAVSGGDNWTANGVALPQLQGILWRGVVSGDAVLSCASASIRSLVYVFEDGVFHEARTEAPDGFGYLADVHGNPCLRGEVHSTYQESLGRNLLASLVAGAGSAAAAEQTVTRTDGAAQTQTLTGSAFDLFLGQAVESAAHAYSELLARYASDAWDAVVVPAGQEVDIHLTASIPVFHNAAQRIHDETTASLVSVASGGLD